MLNELLHIAQIRGALEDRTQWADCMQPLPQGDKISVCFDEEGKIASITRWDEGIRWYTQSNQEKGLAFKYGPGRQFAASIKFTTKLLEENKGIPELDELLLILPKIDVVEASKEIKQFIVKNELKMDKTYVLFDVKGTKVHVISVLKAFNELIMSKPRTSDGVDFFGNSIDGFKEKNFKSATLPFYSNNDENPTYQKYGNAICCKIGKETRTKIANIYEGLRKDNLTYRVGSNVVLTTLTNGQDGLETLGSSVEETLDYPAFKSLCESLKGSLDGIQGDLEGYDAVISIIGLKGKCAPNLQYTRTVSSKQVGSSIDNYYVGMDNIWKVKAFSPRPCGFRQLQKVLNGSWNSNLKEAKRKKVDGKELEIFSIQESYELFFGNKSVARKAIQVFAAGHIPMLMTASEVEEKKRPYLGRYCWPVAGLLLHILGVEKETFMDRWPFLLGYMLQKVNYLHKVYHTERGKTPPSQLLGAAALSMARRNPLHALEILDKSADFLFNWAGSPVIVQTKFTGARTWNYAKYKEIRNQLLGLMPILPTRMSAIDVTLLGHGFVYNDYVKNSDAPSEEEAVV